MRFIKYQGLGNDFVVVDLRSDAATDAARRIQDPEVVRRVCDRRFGVGADGVLPILPPSSGPAVATMRVLNADGSEAEMCGNGLRCIAKQLWESDPALRTDELVIDTGAGALTCRVHAKGDRVERVRVDMGHPRLTRAEIPMTGPAGERAVAAVIDGVEHRFTAVSMGNPHAVAFLDDGVDLRALAEAVGPSVEIHAAFPARTNVEFARVLGPAEIDLVVWERGCGITLACGTGACATAVAAVLEGRVAAGVALVVHLPGGDLEIEVAEDLSRVLMTGPAVRVFQGELTL